MFIIAFQFIAYFPVDYSVCSSRYVHAELLPKSRLQHWSHCGVSGATSHESRDVCNSTVDECEL